MLAKEAARPYIPLLIAPGPQTFEGGAEPMIGAVVAPTWAVYQVVSPGREEDAPSLVRLPGGSLTAATCDVVQSIVRRAKTKQMAVAIIVTASLLAKTLPDEYQVHLYSSLTTGPRTMMTSPRQRW